MQQIIECIPNVSEGLDFSIINKLSLSIEKVKGVKLLHTDIGESANRTVFTFAGTPDCVCGAAYNLINEAKSLIDMTNHHGNHPRIGAVDVCPLVPIQGITIEETIRYADDLASKVGSVLNIPVYLYEKSAQHSERIKLEDIRKGGYEGLAEKMKLREWKPDFGPANFDPHFGAIIIGARNFLIAYNINLATSDISIAKYIAAEIRESGITKNVIEKGINRKIRVPGILKAVKAIGWYDERNHCAQVSTNIVDYKVSSIIKVHETIISVAQKFGVNVTGSEIVGLVPLDSIIDENQILLNNNDPEGVEKKLITFSEKIQLNLWTENSLNDKILDFKL